MKRFVLAAAVLVLTACTDARETPVEPAAPRLATGDTWRIFTTQTPADIVDATGGWEVATRFKASVAGCITHLHFYRASTETGANNLKLWTDSGTKLLDIQVSSPTAGWNTVQLFSSPGFGPYFNISVCIPANTYYRVSVNTNSKQAKTYDYFTANGSITRGPLTADYSYYGQPTGSMPTQGSTSIYFVDVTFQES